MQHQPLDEDQTRVQRGHYEEEDEDLAETVKLSKEFLYFRNDFAIQEVKVCTDEVNPTVSKFKRAMY